MGYLHIPNLYKNQDILLFKECYALEKIHGTSAHIRMKDKKLSFFSGGVKLEEFVALFNEEELRNKLQSIPNVVIYGEAYGGKCQKMSKTYGEQLRFIVFDVKINEMWLAVPQAERFALDLGLEFVDYVKIPATLEVIDSERDKESTQAIRNGMGRGKTREGVVLRPLIEVKKNNGERIIAKHKNEKFSETKTKRPMDPEKLKVLKEANAIADEWVTEMRLIHVLDKIKDADISKMPIIIKKMLEDIEREGEGEIVWSKAARKAIGAKTARAVKKYFQNKLYQETT